MKQGCQHVGKRTRLLVQKTLQSQTASRSPDASWEDLETPEENLKLRTKDSEETVGLQG